MRLAPLLTVLFAAATFAQQPPARPTTDMPLLTVTGFAETTSPPDRATLRIGVTTTATQATDAQSQVNESVQKTLDALKDAGIPSAQISTSGLSLSPIYSQPSPRDEAQGKPFTPKITAYQASNSVLITINDLKKVGPSIDAAVAAGANQIDSLTFDLKDDTAARSRALELAVKQARAKAETLAKAAGVTLAYLHDIDETFTANNPIPMARAMAAMDVRAPGTPIEPGQLHLTATVTLRYAISPK